MSFQDVCVQILPLPGADTIHEIGKMGKASLENADLMNHYSIEKGQVNKKREVVMHLSIKLEGCKTPRRIKDELPIYKK